MKNKKMAVALLLKQFAAFTVVLAIAFSSFASPIANRVVANASAKNSYLNSTTEIDLNSLEDITDQIKSQISNEYVLTDETYDRIDENELVWAIVELNEVSVIDRYLSSNSKMDLNDYLKQDSMKNYSTSLINSQNEIFAKISNKCDSLVKYNYTSIINGFAVLVRYGNIEELEEVNGVKKVIISQKYNPASTEKSSGGVVENDVNVYETGIYDSSNVDYDGEGTLVAVLDTGLDYYHSAFQNMPTGEVAYTKDDITNVVDQTTASVLSASKETDAFALKAEQVYLSAKVPFAYDYADKDADVYPISDHGTHVAGIIAGKDDEITGVATQAQLAIMKVFSNLDKGANTVDILAALADCIVLNVDVINMSLGTSCGFAREEDDDSINEIYDKIKDSGISLIVAASNDYSSAMGSENGDTNLTSNPDSGTIGSPASYDAAMSVASIKGVKTPYLIANEKTTVYFTESAKTTGDKNDFVAQILGKDKSATFDYVSVPGLGASSDYLGLDVKDKIVLVKRGTSTFEEKVLTAQSKGARAIIIYNNQSGTISMSVGNNATIPSCSISMDIGNELAAVASGSLAFSTEYKAGPFMSDFSSWGTLPDLELKPDITAHGGDIYSAVRGGYDRISGTSMACPNMAGATLLVREYVKKKFPELTNVQITELSYQLMMSTATIANNEEGNPYSPRKQGAGLADILNATTTDAYLWVNGSNKTKISLGDDKNKTGHYVLTFNITNISANALSYSVNPIIMSETVSSDGKTVAEKAHMFTDSAVKIAISNGVLGTDSHVIVAGYQTAEITVTIDLTKQEKQYLEENFENGMYVEGFIQLLNDDAKGAALSIPWLAFYGDWTEAPMFDVTEYEVGDSNLDDSILEKDKVKPDAYASVPMGGFRIQIGEDEYQEAAWGLGVYGYKLADGYEQPESQEDKAAISENIDSTYGINYIAAGLLRGAKSLDIVITNTVTGEVIYSDVYTNARKSYYSGGRTPGYIEIDLSAAEYGLANNTQYTFTMVGKLDWDGEQNNKKNTLTFSFYVDSEAPVLRDDLTKVRIEEDSNKNKKYLLDMYIYDNHYIQCYSIATFTSIKNGELVDKKALVENTIPVDSARGVTNKVTFDLTEYWDDILINDENLYIEIFDYAKNNTSYKLKLPRVYASNIEFDSEKTDYTIKINETVDVTKNMILTPADAWKDNLVWESSDDSVVRVKNGEIFGIKAGTATVTVTSELGATATINVTVTDKKGTEVTLQELKLNKEKLKIEQGEEFELVVTLEPWTFEGDVEISWRTTNSKIVSILVDETDQRRATIKGVTSGNANIIVSSGKYITSRCSVTVEEMYEVEGRYLKSYKGQGDENGVVNIPDDLGIMYIYQYAFFRNPHITKIIVPEGVIEIGEAAIYGCDNLTEVVLPDSMETISKFGIAWNPLLEKVDLGGTISIKDLAFTSNTALTDIDLSNVYFIGARTFYRCTSLTTIDISNVGQTGELAFSFCTSLLNIKMSPNTSIGSKVFYSCTSLTNVTIPTNYLGSYAFYGCTSLQDVVFTKDIDNIDDAAFYKCTALSYVTFLGKVRRIGMSTFAGCTALTSVTLPDGLEEVADTAFADCKAINSVKISAGAKLTTIERGVFGNCTALSSYIVEEGNKYLSVNDGILYDKAQQELISVPFGKYMKEYTVLSSVKKIGDYAFSHMSNLTKITLRNVEEIGEGAFYSCYNLATIDYGSSIYKIGDSAFYACSAIRKIELPNTVEIIGDSAFAGCTYNSVTYDLFIPNSVREIGFNAFRAVKGIKTVIFEEGINLVELGGQSFAECTNLVSITLPDGLEKIGNNVFTSDTALTTVVFPESLVEMGIGTFSGCTGLKNIVSMPGMYYIPEKTYGNCTGLTEVVIPENILYLDPYAFYGCTRLTSVDFNEVIEVGEYAFFGTKINSVSSEKIEYVGVNSFARNTSLVELILPNVSIIDAGAFHNCAALTSEMIDIRNVLYIFDGAFYNCGAISSINVDNALYIGIQAFANTGLTSIKMSNVMYIGAEAFLSSYLEKVDINSQVMYIGEMAFAYVISLNEITVAEENEYYFTDSNVLYSILDNGLYEIHTYPLGKEGKEYTILEDTVRINLGAFIANQKLETLVFPNTLKSIGTAAFYDSNITNFNFNSVVAPALESIYNAESESAYENFVTNINSASTLELNIVYPINGMGYNEYLWVSFFKNATTGEFAPDQDVLDFIKAVNNIPEVITEDTVYLVDIAIELRDSVTKDMMVFVSSELLAKYEKAVADAEEFRTNNSDKNVINIIEPQSVAKTQNTYYIVVIIILLSGFVGISYKFFAKREKRRI